ncbi:lipase 3 [Solenopsis invicta]|uniref:lipase 3 n=1 Tax=Solenopsis invicta TaxID=13686 RepID=UPI00193E480D|nr:lipase 3 [Solenopsis invicta]
MLLPILLISILTSTNAGLIDDIINKIPKLDPSEMIPEIPNLSPDVPEDAKLTTMQLISKYGYNGEEHNVTTSDGYILAIHRITGPVNSTDSNKPVAFVVPGILCDSSCYTITGNRSLGFVLADAGYDVWIANPRGTTYSREHTDKTISDRDYWNFSWHEIGTIDLPANIDYIVKNTGREKMFYIGHSQGTTSFFVMATDRPEYQEHILEMYAMAPIAYCGRMKSPLLQLLSQITELGEIAQFIGVNEFNLNNKLTNIGAQLVCSNKAITQPICENALFLTAGFNSEQFDSERLPAILGHYPTSASVKQFLHYGQLIKSGIMITSGRFQHYDYRLGNIKKYHSLFPPKYDVSKITAPVHLYYSENDWLANTKDVDKLSNELGNLASKTLVADKKFNHIDYMWAKDVMKYVYEPILNQMSKARQ